jgi:hypothetical protein
MQHFFFAWVVWLMLEAMLLPTAVAFPPACARPCQSPLSISFAQSYANPGGGLLKQTSSFSEEFGLQGAQGRRQVLTLPRSALVLSQGQEKDDRLRLVLVPSFSPLLVFFPRKLSPPSAEDDPFFS